MASVTEFTAFEYLFERESKATDGHETAGTWGAPCPEEQGSDYEAGTVTLDGQTWHIRTARVTPKKPGAFVAFWRRDDATHETRPFEAGEVGAGLMVFVRDGERFGVFRFTAAHLGRLGITSGGGEAATRPRAGKRGFRVYPSWVSGLNPQATKTQRQQDPAFVPVH